MGTALLRGLYNAVGAGLVSFLMTYQVTRDWRDAGVVGAITALGALGFRGGFEGSLDSQRQKNGDVKPSDVQPNP